MGKCRAVLAASALLMALAAVPAPPRAVADAAGKGGDYVPLTTPYRALTTVGGAKKAPASTTNVKVAGVGGVPATGVSAVLVDLYGHAASQHTWFVAWPTGSTKPAVVNLVVQPDTPGISGTAVVPVGSGGQISVYNDTGSVHMGVDIQGYFLEAPSATGGRGGFVPVPAHPVITTAAVIDTDKTLTVTVPTSAVPSTAGSVFLGVRVAATVAGSLSAAPAGVATGNSSYTYPVAASSSAISVKLGTGGKIVILNRGNAAVTVWLTVEGYFSASPTTGAGLRPVTGRLVNGVTIAKDGILDVAVGGRLGLPTRGIAGAAITFMVRNNTTGGYLKAWPFGSAVPTGRVLTYPADVTRASLSTVKVGAEGKVRVFNESNGPVSIWVDLIGWFADPLPQVPPRQDSRTQALQLPPAASATLGFVEYAYVDNIGRLRHGHQTDPGSTASIQWTTISDGDAYSGPPALTYLQNGVLQVSGQNINSDVYARTQTAAGGPWGGWSNLGGSMAGPPTYGRLNDGRSVLFAVDTDGRLWHRMQNEYWKPAGDFNLAGTLTVVATRNGLQVFGIDTSGVLRTTHYQDGALSASTSLGGSGLTGSPAVVVYPGYMMRAVVRASDGTIVTKRQHTEGGPFDADWSTVGTFTAISSPAAVVSPVTGRTEIVATGTDNLIHSTGELSQGSGQWREWKWTQISVEPATELTAFTYNPGSGPIWAIVYRDQNLVNWVSEVRESGFAGQPAAFGSKQLGKA